METNELNYFKQKIYEISGVPKSSLEKIEEEPLSRDVCRRSMENLAKRNKKTVDELLGEDQSKGFIIQIGGLRIRFVYDPCILIDYWKHFSIHISYTKYSWQWPWAKWNFHMAYRKEWPFIKIGFRNIYHKLYKGGGF